MKSKDNDKFEIKDADFESMSVKRKEISINGKALPLAIGDKIRMSDDDPFPKTVTCIMVFEDSRVQYAVEWYDQNSGNFQTETFTLTELKLLNSAAKKKGKIIAGFSREYEN